jgi:predicted membrane channel-forming protein YqfA (hemolysin III family)
MKDKKSSRIEIKMSIAIVSFVLIMLGFLSGFFKQGDPNGGIIFLLLFFIMEMAFVSAGMESMELRVPSVKRLILKYKNNIFDIILLIILATLIIAEYFTALYSMPLAATWALFAAIIAQPIGAILWGRMKEKWPRLEKIKYNGRRSTRRKSRAIKKRFLQLGIGIYERERYGW